MTAPSAARRSPEAEKQAAARITMLACAAVLCGILVAGLWPFHAPRNGVAWLPGGGIRFGRHGTVWSSGRFPIPGPERNPSVTIELWVRPASLKNTHPILAFSSPETPNGFSIRQYHDTLIAQTGPSLDHYAPDREISAGNVFRAGQPILITFTAGPRGTAVYADGNRLETSREFRPTAENFMGHLIVGASPEGDSWTGDLLGLAIYHQELAPLDVLRHYASWKESGPPQTGNVGSEVAIYRFNEQTGNIVRNLVLSGPDLEIPERYTVLHKLFLEPFWEEFRSHGSFWKDALINVAGFVPFGFVFSSLFWSVRPIRRAAVVTLLLGTATSLTIELLQALLPTRSSGTTDLITNTLGTALGVVLYRFEPVQSLYNRVTAFIVERVHSFAQ